MDDEEPKMWEEELEDEWERTLREDDEEMARTLDETWLEAAEAYGIDDKEYKEVRDRFGDG